MPPTSANQTIMVEVDGRIDALEQKLVLAEQKIQQLQRSASGTGGLQVADQMGDKYATLSRRVASASEEMARMGEVGGRGLRELISGAGEAAFAFGPTGALVGAIGIAGLAIVDLFKRARDEMDKTAQQFAADVAQMANAGKSTELQEKLKTLYTGSPIDQKGNVVAGSQFAPNAFKGSIYDLQGQIAALERQSKANGGVLSAFVQAQIEEVQKQLDPLLAQAKTVETAILNIRSQSAENAGGTLLGMHTTAESPKAADDAAAAAAKLTNQLALEGAAAGEAANKSALLAQVQGKDLVTAIEAAFGAMTGDLAGAASRAIDDRIEKLREELEVNDSLSMAEKLRLNDELNALDKIQQAQNDAKPALDALTQTVAATGVPGHSAVDGIHEIQDALKPVEAAYKHITDLGGQDADMQQKIFGAHKAIAELLAKLESTTDHTSEKTAGTLRDLEATAQVIQQAVSGAVQLGAAMGLVDKTTASILSSVGQAAAQLPVLAKALRDYHAGAPDANGNPTGIGTVIASALPVAGAVATVVSSFLGAAQAQHQAAVELRNAADAFAKSAQQYIAGSGSGSSVVDQLAQNAQQYADLVAQGIDLAKQAAKSGNTGAFEAAAQGLNGLPDANQQHIQQITADFWAGIAQSMNDLTGPAGALENQLAALKTTLQQNLDAVAALGKANGESAAQIAADQQQVIALYQAQALAAQLAAAEQQEATAAGLALDTEAAEAHTLAQRQQLARDQLDEQQREEMQKAVDQRAIDAAAGVSTALDDETIAQLKVKDAAQQAALAAQQFAETIDAVESAVSQTNDILGITGAPAILNLASGYNQNNPIGPNTPPRFDLSSFDLSTKTGDDAAIAYLQGIYSSLDPNGPLYDTYVQEIQTLIDGIRALPPEQGGAATPTGAAGSGAAAAANGGQSPGEVAVSEVRNITTTQGDVFIDTLRAILAVDREWLAIVKNSLGAIARTIIAPPQIPLGLGALAAAGGAGGSVTVSVTVQQTFNGPVGQVDRAAALAFGQLILQEIDEGLAHRFALNALIQGQVMQSG